MPAGSLWMWRCAMVTSSAQVRFLSGADVSNDVAVLVGDALGRHAEIVRGDGDQLVLDLACAAWKAAPPSMIAMRLPTGLLLGSALSESARTTRMLVGIELQHLADHGADQRLVALPRRRGVHGRGDRADQIDADAAGIHPGGGVVLGIEQRLERRIAAARLQARRDADAGEHARRAQPVALGEQLVVAGVRQHLVDHGVVVAASRRSSRSG